MSVALAEKPQDGKKTYLRQFELVERVRAYDPSVDEALLNKAYVFSVKAHGDQLRHSGDPYYAHPIEVAGMLANLHMDVATVCTALLHDVLEDTDTTPGELAELFTPEIADLVRGVTKLSQLELSTPTASRERQQAENFQKFVLAMSRDVRVLIVKLCDRLHNMRTLDFHPKPKRREAIARETLEIYAPLARRVGLDLLCSELEDLSFRHLNPDAFQSITKRLDEWRRDTEGLIAQTSVLLRDIMDRHGIEARIYGREKRAYAIWRKLQRQGIDFEDVADIHAFRIVVDAVPTCYRVLGILHTEFRSVPARFRDFISVPKPNGYQSLHTTVLGPENRRVEIQIRTERMEDVAERGVAAHWAYKDESYAYDPERASLAGGDPLERIRPLVEMLEHGQDPDEFLENAKLEMFTDQVFTFTPKGDLIALPRGATPIDFAYAIHSDIGDGCAGARINGQSMPVVTQLANGDEVEIEVDPDHVPPPVWESVVVTGRARAGIRRAGRHKAIEQFGQLGEAILQRAFTRADLTFRRKDVERVLSKLGRSSLGDALASVGRGEIAAEDVLRATHPDYQPDRHQTPRPKEEEGWFNLAAIRSVAFRVPGIRRMVTDGAAPDLPVRGVSGEVSVRFDPGGGAVPGDRIVGIATKGERTDYRGITIYAIQSTGLQTFEDRSEGWLDLRWDVEDDALQRFPGRIRVAMANKPGTLAEVTGVFGETNVNIAELYLAAPERDLAVIEFGVEVWDLKHLSRLMTQLRGLACVTRVDRVWQRDGREGNAAVNL